MSTGQEEKSNPADTSPAEHQAEELELDKSPQGVDPGKVFVESTLRVSTGTVTYTRPCFNTVGLRLRVIFYRHLPHPDRATLWHPHVPFLSRCPHHLRCPVTLYRDPISLLVINRMSKCSSMTTICEGEKKPLTGSIPHSYARSEIRAIRTGISAT